MTEQPRGLLPITRSGLVSDARLERAVRRIGARHRMDYFDDDAVRAMFTEHKRLLARTGRGRGVIGILALLVGFCWPLFVQQSPTYVVASDPYSGRSAKDAISLGAAVLLVVVGVCLVVSTYRAHMRQLRHPRLTGYRQVLAAATAYGVPVARVPDWLIGKDRNGGRARAPLPRYETGPTPGTPAPAQPTDGQRVPEKPGAVAEYERIADQGGWHDETGWLLLFAGGGGLLWAATELDSLLPGVLALGVCTALAVWVWTIGAAQGRHKDALRDQARSYVQALMAAQAAGSVIPELSPELQALIDD
ncbi:hypothetical protein [Streptomyces coffeae]|uniref:DUF4231 domain-containing protein n=1 Tax=Streptomyces coffeae TaxID=621382 RepID=A0ABS1N5S4_9ACTN|nr:hypothetical protein [Streptomyces coffeae]MBL1095393.1 hypothetical protein [Streptomyces coffeae]